MVRLGLGKAIRCGLDGGVGSPVGTCSTLWASSMITMLPDKGTASSRPFRVLASTK